MSEILHNAFHFDSLVWHGSIALYLFLLGLSCGAAMIGIALKRWVIDGPAWQNGFIRAVAIIGPIGIVVSLGILIMHLTKPMAFWKLMIYYNLNSVMSLGVIGFQIYTTILFVWLALVFQPMLSPLFGRMLGEKVQGIWDSLIAFLKRYENGIEIFTVLLAAALGAYTGFLLSALKTYPMLNNPWLPVLFFFSGLSSGAAGTLLLGVTVFGEKPTSKESHWIHKIEKPAIFIELLVIGIFFAWLMFEGGRSEVAALAAIGGGFWATVFWVGVIALGLLFPLALQTLVPASLQHRVSFIVILTSSSLIGVVCLRYFILYAGQLTVY